MDEDTQDAAEFQRELEERQRREDELLARAPGKHAQLKETWDACEANLKALNWAFDRIFRG